MLPPMLARVKSHFDGSKLTQMSDGTYCIVRDLGPVKGGKGMRHHEVLFTFSFGAIRASIGRSLRGLVRRPGELTGSDDWKDAPQAAVLARRQSRARRP
jgi:hypothetical protein